MSAGARWTPAQIRGVTNTAESSDPEPDSDPGEWTEDLEVSIYGETVWTLPGFGESGERCGEWFPQSFCDEAAEKWGTEEQTHDPVDLGRHQCGRRSCSRCWSTQWARPRTVAAVSRLGAARYIQHPRAVHAVLSPSEGSVTTIQGFYDARRRAVELAKEHGIRGGMVVPHGYRVLEEYKQLFKVLKERGEVEGGIWRWVRECDRHWRDMVYWSPHFHVLGLAEDVAPSAPDEDDGWILKNVKRGSSYSLEPFTLTGDDGYDDMARAVRYLLSHATFEAGETRQVVTWFGELHSTNFCPDPQVARERKTEPTHGPLSQGTWDTICRKAEEVVGGPDGRDDGEGGGGDEERCEVDGCDGHRHAIWEVPTYIDQRKASLSMEAMVRLRVAYDWAVADQSEMPIGGWPSPRSEEAAHRAFEEMTSSERGPQT
jgi:hypothetical protein